LRSRRLKLTFVGDRVTEPIIHTLGKRFDVVTNIRRADIREGTGWVILEASASEQRLDEAMRYLAEMGVRVDDLEQYVE
jgi:L-aspartate semialdehyde sulfurtransferase ferredoxin